MRKSYVPQLLFLARRLSIYITRHQSTIFVFVTDPAKQEAITNCNACLTSLVSLLNRPTEAP